MDPVRWGRVKALFRRAFERVPPEQRAVLHAARRDDVELRETVERPLRADLGGAGPLGSPTAAELDRTSPKKADGGPVARTEDSLPSRIGPYLVRRELGRGGMGTVYLAERDEPGLRKTVAVKVVRRGMDSAFVVSRFRTERQILAALEHPGIARLYDGGTTEEGLPYFVMEHVDGEDVLTYCDARELPITARLQLFLRVCAAVQYAHQSLVIHRDLKPSNVLVTAAGEPKLLDFGIAKLLIPQLAEDGSDETASVIRLLTPDYASPEHVRGERVTTASDVYSLGVILYELLSGHRPYRVKSASPSEIERAMLETDLEPPSTASARTEKLTARDGTGTLALTPSLVSARRKAAPGKLRRRLRGDLDNIVLKALRREKAERYATAAELAEDIRRHLEGFPVRARADRRAYRAAKFLRRNRPAVAAVAVAALSMMGGLGVAVRQARVAEAERRRAEARFQDVRRLANSVIHELHDSIADLPGATAARRLLVTRALEYLDRLAGESRDDLALKRELADAYQRVGRVQGGGVGANLGDTAGALESYRKALAVRQSLAARKTVDPQDVLGLALLEFDLGAMRRALGQLPSAEQSFLSSAARLEALMTQGALPDPQRRRVGAVYQRLAEVQTAQGKREAALGSAQRAAAEAEAVWRARPDDATARSVMAAASFQLAEALAEQGRHAEALERTRQARALLEAALRENPLDAQQTRILLFALNGEGRHLWRQGDLPGAVQVSRHAVEVAEEAWRRDPRDRWSQMGVAVAAKMLGDVLLEVGNTSESVRRLRQALRLTSQAVAEDPQYNFARMESASIEHGLARALLSQGTRESVAEGCAGLERARAFWAGLRDKGELPAAEAKELETLPSLLARCRSRH